MRTQMTAEQISTFCRVCESSCGLLAERENDTILSLRPDKSHPVTGGFACPKGLLALDIHRDEDRLNYPLCESPYFDSPFGPLRTIMGNLPGIPIAIDKI